MTKYIIVPSHGEEVQCHFTIPRKGKTKDIEFTVRRMDYIDHLERDLVDWSTERMKPTPVLDGNGDPVLDDDGNPVTETPEDISDREAILAHLRLAGVPATTMRSLESLTNGELTHIHTTWAQASKEPIPVRYRDSDTGTVTDA